MGTRRQQRHRPLGNCLAVPTLASQASLSIMAKRPLLLLLAMWTLAGGLWLGAEARAAPYGVKLCGREFIRAVIFTCGGSRWRRSDILAHEAMGEAGEVVCVGRGRDGAWDGPKEPGTEMKPGARSGESLPYNLQMGRLDHPGSCAICPSCKDRMGGGVQTNSTG